jgi:hypothetical protein
MGRVAARSKGAFPDGRAPARRPGAYRCGDVEPFEPLMSGQGPAPSGARLLGDDYQHVLTWLHAAQLVHRDPHVTRVELEKRGAGNVDDLVVRTTDGADQYHQVKFVRNPGKEPLDANWFTDKGKNTQSPLQMFHESWKKLTKNGVRPYMVLHTNRTVAGGDAVMACVDGITDRLVPKIEQGGPKSAVGKMRHSWAEHLGIEEPELLEMLADLRIRAARASINELREHCRWVMDASGLLNTADDVDKGMLIARRWVEEGVRLVGPEIVADVVERAALRAVEHDPRATVLIQAIDHDVYPELATEVIDWVDAFPGDEPIARRAPASDAVWTERFAPDLTKVEQSIRAQGYHEVRLVGAFRLATAIYAGYVFSDTRRYGLLVPGRSSDGAWSDIASYGEKGEVGVVQATTDIGRGDELAIGLSISGNVETAVLKHIEQADLPVKQLALIEVPKPGTDALPDGAAVRGWAAEVRGLTRELAESGWPRIHLFMSGPQTAAVLLGHFWNGMPPTQLWEHLGVGRGYTPAFVIPGA